MTARWGTVTALAVVGLLAFGPRPALAELHVWVAAPGDSLPAVSEPDTSGNPGSGALIVPARMIYSPDDTLVAAFRLSGVLEEGEKTLGEGIPATLTLVVDLWRERSGWWDSLVHSQAYVYRFRRDVWSGSYEIMDPARNSVTLGDPEALRDYLERVHEVPLGTAGRFEHEKSYYLTVRAILKPLDLNDLEEVNAWLNGDVTQGRGGGGLLGIPKALANLAVDLSGLGDKSATGRSRTFVPNPGG
jgi:hypothetical protein